MTLCTNCNEEYLAHEYGDLVKCNRDKDKRILDLKLALAFAKDKSHTSNMAKNTGFVF